MSPRPPQDLPIWLLAGQSNMEGVGLLRDALAPDPRVWCFSSAGNWEIAREPLHRLWESFTPVHARLRRPALPPERSDWTCPRLAEQEARERVTGIGPGLAFGQALAEATGCPVGLLPCAHGSTSLDQWNPLRKEDGADSLYGAMLERVRRAGGRLEGILWYQGESDARNPEAARTYGPRLAAWISRLRADLARPDLPVLVVQIGRYLVPCSLEIERGIDLVREAQQRIAGEVPRVFVTTSIDLGLEDTIHLAGVEQNRLGRRLARLARGLTGPRLERIEPVPLHCGLGGVRLFFSGVSGAWQPAANIRGFSLHGADGSPRPGRYALDARPDPENPTRLLLPLSAPPDDGDCLGHGMGANPLCNAVDAADMPLPAFAPRPILANGSSSRSSP